MSELYEYIQVSNSGELSIEINRISDKLPISKINSEGDSFGVFIHRPYLSIEDIQAINEAVRLLESNDKSKLQMYGTE